MAFVVLFICLLQALLVQANMRLQLFDRQAPIAACSIIPSIFSFCESATPGFSDFSPASKAPCICYSFSGTSTEWVPEYFDSVVTSCGEWVKTVDPIDYSVYQGMENFCSSVGDVLAATTIAITAQTTAQSPVTAPITATPVHKPPPSEDTGPITAAAAMADGNIQINNAACTSVVNILASCISKEPAFRTLPNSAQASCACYSKGVYDPSGFDVQVSLCANYVSTADPAYLSNVISLEGFCTSYAGPASQTASASTSASTSPSHTTIVASPPPSTSLSETTIVVFPPPGTTSPTAADSSTDSSSLNKTTIVVYPPSGTGFTQSTLVVKPSVGSSSWGGAWWKVLWGLAVMGIATVFLF